MTDIVLFGFIFKTTIIFYSLSCCVEYFNLHTTSHYDSTGFVRVRGLPGKDKFIMSKSFVFAHRGSHPMEERLLLNRAVDDLNLRGGMYL